MRGLMQDRPLALPHVFHRAEQLFGHKPIVTATVNGEVATTVAEWAVRVRRLATALDTLGVPADGRVATFCWNTAPHLELYMAAPCTGRVLHTLNIRLFPEQLVYIANHAEDDVVFVDRSLLPVFLPLRSQMRTVRQVVVIDDGADHPLPDDAIDYDELLASSDPFEGRFEVDDENQAAAMCYSSGTTGNPKGVVYSHRSTLLHSLITLTVDGLGLSERDVVMPVVPMFHANAWGLPYAALLAGSSTVFPGPNMTPKGVLGLLERHRVTVTAGVPTIWLGALPLLGGYDLSGLTRILCGGSAVPRSLSEAYRTTLGVPILHAWGMTETSPVATVASPRTQDDALDDDARADARVRQGQPTPLVELRVVEPSSGEVLPWDDKSSGEIQAAGPWVAAAYYRDESGAAQSSSGQFTEDGWLRTGDVATVDRYGSVRIVDRTKDLVKSGGEWISSVELENALMAHPKVVEAAVIGVPHERWVERPLACVVVEPGESLTPEEVRAHLEPLVPRWWLPDAVEFIDEVPKTSVGKFSKRTLRDKFAGYELPEVDPAGRV
jgi:fatty-acyl-CoA synthase